MSRNAGIRFASILIALMIPSLEVESSDVDVESSPIFVSVTPEDGGEIPELQKIILDSALLTLKRNGYIAYSSDSGLSERSASFLIRISYKMEGTNALLDLSLSDVENKDEKGSLNLSSEIDLTLDTDVAKSVRELIEISGVPPPAVAAPEAVASGDDLSVPMANVETYPDEARHMFSVSAGFAPFIAVGETLSYFSIGVEPSILFKFNFPLDFLRLGVLLRTTLFRAQGILIEADNVLLSAAPDIGFVISPTNIFSVYLHVAGGPAGFFLKNERIGEYWKIIPFVSGGGGVSFILSSVFGLTVNVDYSVYFEKSITIMGISPSMYAVFSF